MRFTLTLVVLRQQPQDHFRAQVELAENRMRKLILEEKSATFCNRSWVKKYNGFSIHGEICWNVAAIEQIFSSALCDIQSMWVHARTNAYCAYQKWPNNPQRGPDAQFVNFVPVCLTKSTQHPFRSIVRVYYYDMLGGSRSMLKSEVPFWWTISKQTSLHGLNYLRFTLKVHTEK